MALDHPLHMGQILPRPLFLRLEWSSKSHLDTCFESNRVFVNKKFELKRDFLKLSHPVVISSAKFIFI